MTRRGFPTRNTRGIEGVLFDAFGTLCEVTDYRRPFEKIAAASSDRAFARSMLMTSPQNLRSAAGRLAVDHLNLEILEADLAAEVKSICLYPEVVCVLNRLRSHGLKVAIVSNLAMPYAEPLLRLLPFPLHAYAWSFEVGAMKPDPRIFSWACDAIDVHPENCVMVGDSYNADYCGAQNSGMAALHLKRTGYDSRCLASIPNLDGLIAFLDRS